MKIHVYVCVVQLRACVACRIRGLEACSAFLVSTGMVQYRIIYPLLLSLSDALMCARKETHTPQVVLVHASVCWLGGMVRVRCSNTWLLSSLLATLWLVGAVSDSTSLEGVHEPTDLEGTMAAARETVQRLDLRLRKQLARNHPSNRSQIEFWMEAVRAMHERVAALEATLVHASQNTVLAAGKPSRVLLDASAGSGACAACAKAKPCYTGGARARAQREKNGWCKRLDGVNDGEQADASMAR